MCSGVLRLPKEKEKPLYVQLAERDDLFDFLGLLPSWIWGATIWYAFTKIILDNLSAKKPGTEINLAIIAGDFLPDWLSDSPADLPPGVKLAAFVDVSLAALDIGADLWKFLKEAPPPGIRPAETITELGAGPIYAFSEWLEGFVPSRFKK